ncbi:MAG TPA: Ig-like domain-containing protein, partial [Anaerolineales bacterium]|nr:Ig-like domain-containing protein [Anaerolineales bacterium]
ADTAAHYYFAKPATELTLGEAAWLAAASQAPNLVAGLPASERLARRNQAVHAMYSQGWISARQAAQASQEPLTFAPVQPGPISELAPRFSAFAFEELTRSFNRYRMERGGLRILTTLDADLQRQVNCATTQVLAQLQPEEPLPAPEEKCAAADLLPVLAPFADSTQMGAAVVVLDPKTGQTLALAEIAPPELTPFDPPGRPAGALLTPFIYLAAFRQGLSPASLTWDLPAETGLTADQETFADAPIAAHPDVDWTSYQGPVRLRLALANDYMAPAYRLVEQLGPDHIWRTARQLGLESYAPSDADFTSLDFAHRRVSLLDFSHTFGALANRGALAGVTGDENTPAEETAPSAVLRVENLNGQTWLDNSQTQSRLVISPQLAYLLIHVLSDEAARWPSLGHPNLLEIGRPAAVKVGRSVSYSALASGQNPETGNDVWTVGATPQRVVGVWVGRTQPEGPSTVVPPLESEAAQSLWRAIMEYIHLDLPAEDWDKPPEVSELVVCDPSGLLPSADCPTTVREIFLAGSEPVQTDSMYQSVAIDRETGRLATVFTPPEQVEQRLYFTLPPAAAAWARATGFPIAPERYTPIDYARAASNPSAAAEITAPENFSYVSGRVIIKGHAAGENFAFYRLQAGAGLNPQRWLQIGADVDQAIQTGPLAEWDTSELNGLYALQLRVVRADQSADTHVIMVTVDNTPPTARIRYPAAGDSVDPGPDGELIFQAEAGDNLALQSVLFFIDDQLVQTLETPPFAYAWKTRPGPHTLRVRAIDRAGNFTEDRIEFSIP